MNMMQTYLLAKTTFLLLCYNFFQELVREARGGEVHVNMEDHKTEEYVKPKATSKPFQGQGHMLGGSVPDVVVGGTSVAAAATPASTTDTAGAEAEAKDKVKVDETKPTTSIQVRRSFLLCTSLLSTQY